MNSDRNLMQFIFNHLPSTEPGRPMDSARYFICLGLFVGFGLVSDTVCGQGSTQFFSDRAEDSEPHQFGDTPSPTEMMARLKYHKKQETPLFDLLRESGVDIFTKLSDDEKKLAGRFVEDMIFNEGLDSERVSPWMDKMNVGDDAKRVLKEAIERAGGDKSAFSPEQRKKIVDNIRKEFLQSSQASSNSNSPTIQNQLRSERPKRIYSAQELKALNDRREEIGLDRIDPENPTPTNREQSISKLQELEERAKRSGYPNQPTQSDQPTQLDQPTPSSQSSGNQTERRAANNDRGQDGTSSPKKSNQSGRRVTQQKNATPPRSDQPINRRPGDRAPRDASPSGNNPVQSANRGFPNITNPANASENLPTERAFDQLVSPLNDSQRGILSKFQKQIQREHVSPQEIREILSDLKKTDSSSDFARQLDNAGAKLNLPVQSRDEIQRAFRSLSSPERNSLRGALAEVDDKLLTQLARSMDSQISSGRGSNETDRFDTSPQIPDYISRRRAEELGKEFLQDAIKTYNDSESGYQLPPAFKQLKDRAEGKQSERQMANFGSLSKKLFEQSTNIFNQEADSSSRRPKGVKPGQRLDQLLAAAAGEALADGDNVDGENNSLLSNALNNVLGGVLDQAVDIADKDKKNRNRDVPENTRRDYSTNTLRQNELKTYNINQFSSSSNSPLSSPSSPSSTSSGNSVDNTAATIADSVSQFEFNGRALLYVAGLIAVIAVAVLLLFRLLPSTDENILKQRELQRRLENNSANPKDLVEAVDLFLLTQFGSTASWWNSKHAADTISTHQPDWRDKVMSLFQVYRWSRYQADGDASVSAEQNDLVKSTLRELSQANEVAVAEVGAEPKTDLGQSSNAEGEATS